MALEIEVSYQDYPPKERHKVSPEGLGYREDGLPREFIVTHLTSLLAECKIFNGRFTAHYCDYRRLAGTKSLTVATYPEEMLWVRYRPAEYMDVISVYLQVHDCPVPLASLFAQMLDLKPILDARTRAAYEAEQAEKQSPSGKLRRELAGELKKKRTRQRQVRKLWKEIGALDVSIADLKQQLNALD